MSSLQFWTENQVGGPYATLAESQVALVERAILYPNLLDLMPVNVSGTVLDYGCGPGHDTILFCHGGADHVYYWDVSPLAIRVTAERLEMHGLSRRASLCPPVIKVDHIHCAGVLHHTEDPAAILKDFRWMLNHGGQARVMIYDGDRSTHSQSEVPITQWWTEQQFTALCLVAGFDAEYMGGYDCSAEWRPDCVAACYRLNPC